MDSIQHLTAPQWAALFLEPLQSAGGVMALLLSAVVAVTCVAALIACLHPDPVRRADARLVLSSLLRFLRRNSQ